MKARPILFSGPMVRALLAGTKTQTRRALRPQPDAAHDHARRSVTGFQLIGTDVRTGCGEWGARAGSAVTYAFPAGKDCITDTIRCPYGQPGDLLIVRETWCPADTQTGAAYCADAPIGSDQRGMGWKPSIHMPRWASRLTLEVTDVRVERLREISRADAIAEGLQQLPASGRWVVEKGQQYAGLASHDPREVYAWLWEAINGPGSWAANPWTWALTFRVHHANVDTVIAERSSQGVAA